VYQIQLDPNGWDPSTLAAIGTAGACAEFLAQGPITVEVTKKGEKVTLDARPFIRGFTAAPGAGAGRGTDDDGVGTGVGDPIPGWDLVLRVGLGGSVKPQAVMRSFLGQRVPPGELDRMVSSLRITRTALALEGQG
jgi:hypothetical protein